jgi:hypothetical protein
MAEEQERWEAEQKHHKTVEALKKTIEKGTGLPEYDEDVYASAAENGFGWSHANYDVVSLSLLNWVRMTKQSLQIHIDFVRTLTGISTASNGRRTWTKRSDEEPIRATALGKCGIQNGPQDG